jgi:hypothetical protein
MAKQLAILEKKIEVLRKKAFRLRNNSRAKRIERIRKAFLDAEWVLTDHMELHTTNMKLAKQLCAFEEEVGTDYISSLFENKEPGGLLESCYCYSDEIDDTLTGKIVCELNHGFLGRMGTNAALLVVRPMLEKLISHFKNLKADLPTISWRIAEVKVELDELLKLVTKHNKYKQKGV